MPVALRLSKWVVETFSELLYTRAAREFCRRWWCERKSRAYNTLDHVFKVSAAG